MNQLATDLAAATGNKVMPVWGDLTQEKQVTRIVQEIVNEWKQIDILVCCAGGNIGSQGVTGSRGGRPERDDALDVSLSDYNTVMDVNLLTTVLVCRAVVPAMAQRRAGRVITIGSVAGTVGRSSGVMYAVAKAAVHEYTRCLAEQMRPYQVAVNCVAPGASISQRYIQHEGGIDKIDSVRLPQDERDQRLTRYGSGTDVAKAVAFLAADTTTFISGQVLRVDGGGQTFPA